MVERVTVPLEGEATLACGLSIKLRFLNQAFSSKADRTSITLSQGSASQELTLDLQTQRRWRELSVALEEIVAPSRAKKGVPARQGSARFVVEKQEPESKTVELSQPFSLSVHDDARLPDGSTLQATEIGPHVTTLLVVRKGEQHALELGELGFGRWQDWVLTRDLVNTKSPRIAQLTITTPTAPVPRLRYGDPFELQPGESVVGPDGLQVALGFVRNLQHEPCVEVQLRQGSMVCDPQIYRNRSEEVHLGEAYTVSIKAVQAPMKGPLQVTLCIDKKGSQGFAFGREFLLTNGQSARGPDSLYIRYPAPGHIHYTDGRSEAVLDFFIQQDGRPNFVRVMMPAGTLHSHTGWDGYTLTVRWDASATAWALVIDKKK